MCVYVVLHVCILYILIIEISGIECGLGMEGCYKTANLGLPDLADKNKFEFQINLFSINMSQISYVI